MIVLPYVYKSSFWQWQVQRFVDPAKFNIYLQNGFADFVMYIQKLMVKQKGLFVFATREPNVHSELLGFVVTTLKDRVLTVQCGWYSSKVAYLNRRLLSRAINSYDAGSIDFVRMSFRHDQVSESLKKRYSKTRDPLSRDLVWLSIDLQRFMRWLYS